MDNDWADFFATHGETVMWTSFYGVPYSFTVEELYQAFKARAKHESYGEIPGNDSDS